jgi:hypothetical protein
MEPAGPARVERRLAAILTADVAGYSRLMGADEEGTLERLKGLRRRGRFFLSRPGSVITDFMVKALEQAIAEIATLPDAEQERIGRRLLSHMQKLRRLREEIDKGIRSLEAGEGKPLDIAEFLDQQHERNGGS